MLIVIALVATGCSGASATPSPQATSGAPSSTATAASPAAAVSPTGAAVTVLEGTWTTGETTCAQQQAAVDRAGFSAEDLKAAGWDYTTCGDLMHGAEFTVRFAGERLVLLNDTDVSWEGAFRAVDSDTFEAGDAGADFYLTYEFAIAGDQLTIDMVRDEFPAASPEELLGEQVAQTVIYESAPFSRIP
jgi:hypothetical protein